MVHELRQGKMVISTCRFDNFIYNKTQGESSRLCLNLYGNAINIRQELHLYNIMLYINLTLVNYFSFTDGSDVGGGATFTSICCGGTGRNFFRRSL